VGPAGTGQVPVVNADNSVMRRRRPGPLPITLLVAGGLTVAACAALKSSHSSAAGADVAHPAATTTEAPTPTTAPVGAGVPTTAPLGAGVVPTAASLVAKAMANAAAQQWAHIDVTTTSGNDVIAFQQDSGPTSGRQWITADGAHAETLLVGGVAYAMGDAAAVTNYFQYPASQTTRLANRWVAFTPGDSGFSDVSDGITLASALKNDTITGPYRVGAVTIVDGQQVVPISVDVPDTSGGPSATGTLYITPGSSTLPVELDMVGSDGSKSDVKYSQWGASVTISAPSGAIPAASIPAS